MYVVSENIHIATPQKVSENFKGVGVSKAHIFIGKYEVKLNFIPAGWGRINQKAFHGGEYGYFPEQYILNGLKKKSFACDK